MMIDIDYTGVDVNYNTSVIKDRIKQIKKEPTPVFVKDRPPIEKIKEIAKKYANYKNIIVIGNGGSITSSFAFYSALGDGKKNLHILHTMEPDYINKIKKDCTILFRFQ